MDLNISTKNIFCSCVIMCTSVQLKLSFFFSFSCSDVLAVFKKNIRIVAAFYFFDGIQVMIVA